MLVHDQKGEKRPLKICVTSDTHTFHRSHPIPDGDIFIHAGDITGNGEMSTMIDFAAWLGKLPQRHKLVVAGNHDRCLDISQSRYNPLARQLIEAAGAHYLLDSSVTIDGKKFYGSPWVPNLDTWAFWDRNRDRFVDAPRDIDVLVTHGPPLGVRDGASRGEGSHAHVGSADLTRYINWCWQLRAHIFGHVHEGYGRSPDSDPVIFANASMCNAKYEPVNAPLVIEI